MQPSMVSPAAAPDAAEARFEQIVDGMKVYDAANKLVGQVHGVYGGQHGDLKPAATRVVAAPAPAAVAGQQPIPVVESVPAPAKVPVFDGALGADESLPRELRERLEHDGFIRIDAGFLKHHRFALLGQIARVAGGVVTLNVLADELIKH